MGVTKSSLDICGILLAKVEYSGCSAYTAVYICNGVDGVFLSPKVQADLGILAKGYPNVSHACAQIEEVNVESECPNKCPTRAPPRERPEKLPAESREDLEAWILREYADSAFNNCGHQPIPKLSGEPLVIHFKEGARPVANLVPIPVPFHWKEPVDGLLDQNVRLRVMEKVGPGTKAVWCSKLVTVS